MVTVRDPRFDSAMPELVDERDVGLRIVGDDSIALEWLVIGGTTTASITLKEQR